MPDIAKALPIQPALQDSEAIVYQLSPALFGALMLVVILINHGIFTEAISFFHDHVTPHLLRKRNPFISRLFFYMSILFLVAAHLVEIGIWGYVLVWMELVENLEEAIYFSGSTYTTLGYGTDIMPESWNVLTTIIALSGMFSIAWTTSYLMNVIGKYHLGSRRQEVCDAVAKRPDATQRLGEDSGR